jgi:hypothetical protein
MDQSDRSCRCDSLVGRLSVSRASSCSCASTYLLSSPRQAWEIYHMMVVQVQEAPEQRTYTCCACINPLGKNEKFLSRKNINIMNHFICILFLWKMVYLTEKKKWKMIYFFYKKFFWRNVTFLCKKNVKNNIIFFHVRKTVSLSAYWHSFFNNYIFLQFFLHKSVTFFQK